MQLCDAVKQQGCRWGSAKKILPLNVQVASLHVY